MNRFDDHPDVRRAKAKIVSSGPTRKLMVAGAARQIALECGADDCGLVSIDDPALEWECEREHVLACFPATRTLLVIVCRMHREQVRSPARSPANLEFHRVGEKVDDVARKIVERLETQTATIITIKSSLVVLLIG